MARMNVALRPDGKINTPPWATYFPIIYKPVNTTQTLTLSMFDIDTTDILRCRLSTNNTITNVNGFNECGSICGPSLPSAMLFSTNYTLVFTLTQTMFYAIALQIEDYWNSTSITPMSSVPIQLLIYGISSSATCSTKPTITDSRPNLGLIHFLFIEVYTDIPLFSL